MNVGRQEETREGGVITRKGTRILLCIALCSKGEMLLEDIVDTSVMADCQGIVPSVGVEAPADASC